MIAERLAVECLLEGAYDMKSIFKFQFKRVNKQLGLSSSSKVSEQYGSALVEVSLLLTCIALLTIVAVTDLGSTFRSSLADSKSSLSAGNYSNESKSAEEPEFEEEKHDKYNPPLTPLDLTPGGGGI